MARKMARSGCPTAVQARATGQQSAPRTGLAEGWKSANIHVGSEFIWGIPARTFLIRRLIFPLCSRLQKTMEIMARSMRFP